MAEFNILIKGGTVIDGSGKEPYPADVGIVGGRIAAVEPDLSPAEAGRTIRAGGLAVAPGFIDSHSHDDLALVLPPYLEAKLRQGVTTTTIGHCGVSAAPSDPNYRADLIDSLSILGAEKADLEELVKPTFGEFLGELEKRGLKVNAAPLVGHSTLRMAAFGSDDRPPRTDELRAMKRLTAQALEAGAFGLSTGLIYVPGCYAATEELIELARVVTEHGGLYSTHLRSESTGLIDSVREAIRIGRESGAQVLISHLKASGKQNWGLSREALGMIETARSRGTRVNADQYPYTAAATYLAAVIPPQFSSGGVAVLAEALTEPQSRARVRAVMETEGQGWDNFYRGIGPQRIIVTTCPSRPDIEGLDLIEAAEKDRVEPVELAMDLIRDNGRAAGAIYLSMAEEDVRRIMAEPYVAVGSDGIPPMGGARVHPRFYQTFPRVLGRYVRDKGVLTLAEAIRKMTSLTARVYGLKNKGLLKKGFDADVTVFDPKTISDTGDFREPHLEPVGIETVIVGGTISLENGKVTEEFPGRVLRHEG